MCIPIYNLKRGTLYIQIPWTKPSVQLSSGKRTKTTIRTFPARNQQHCSKAFTFHTEKRIINRLKKLSFFFFLLLSQLIANMSLSLVHQYIRELRRGMSKPPKNIGSIHTNHSKKQKEHLNYSCKISALWGMEGHGQHYYRCCPYNVLFTSNLTEFAMTSPKPKGCLAYEALNDENWPFWNRTNHSSAFIS